MASRVTRPSVVYLKPLSPFFIFIGTFPPYSFSHNKLTDTGLHNIRILIIIVVMSTLTFISIMGRFLVFDRNYIFALVDTLNALLVWIFVITVLRYTVTKKHLYEKLLQNLTFIENVSTKLDEAPEKMINRKIFIYFMGMILSELFVCCWYYIPRTSTQLKMFLVASLLHFQEEFIFVLYGACICFTTINILYVCHEKYKALHNMLWEIRCSDIYDDLSLLKQIKEIRNLYNILQNITRILNVLFVPQLLILPLIATTWCLLFCIYLKSVDVNYYGNSSEYPYATISYIAAIFIGTSKIIIKCDQIVQESKRIVTTAFHVKESLSIYSSSYSEMEAFIVKISIKPVVFTGCYFFEINRSLLYFILGNSVMYFMLLENF
ncbi:hypothetical protein GWI33_019365 [Rhynchophorus ferrugineus]|uniref:Gustatory receptor n=1 Tax=Rhynchophorus ferrugineus TaxID=354439 RepID=A0A834M496_RHYFE|nr:hypothetical protein GWI33_019365 [Rhynchophorus ferrugineus]